MGEHPHLEEVMLASQRVFDGVFLHVNRDTVRLPDGTETHREYILHPGAVMIIALLDDGRVVMERQWRYPLARAFIEFPAGKIDAGEPPLATCVREMREDGLHRRPLHLRRANQQRDLVFERAHRSLLRRGPARR